MGIPERFDMKWLYKEIYQRFASATKQKTLKQ